MGSVTASWQMIDEVLWENAHSIFLALRKPASDTQLRRLESRLPAKLPRDFVKSWKIHDGLRDSYLGQNRLFNYWALLPANTILAVWKMMTDLQAECEFGGCQFDVTPRIKNDAHWRVGWVPFMDSDGDKESSIWTLGRREKAVKSSSGRTAAAFPCGCWQILLANGCQVLLRGFQNDSSGSTSLAASGWTTSRKGEPALAPDRGR